MKRDDFNYIVDMIIFISLIVVFITGIMKWPGLLRGFGIENVPWRNISKIHDWSGLVMGIGALLHLILHWSFISCKTKNLFKKNEK
jgi:hypothetical protein